MCKRIDCNSSSSKLKKEQVTLGKAFNIYSAFYNEHTIVLTGDFELLIDGKKQDKKSANSFLINSEATFKGDLTLKNGSIAKVVLKYSTFFAMYSIVLLHIDDVYVDGVKGSILSQSMKNRQI